MGTLWKWTFQLQTGNKEEHGTCLCTLRLRVRFEGLSNSKSTAREDPYASS